MANVVDQARIRKNKEDFEVVFTKKVARIRNLQKEEEQIIQALGEIRKKIKSECADVQSKKIKKYPS